MLLVSRRYLGPLLGLAAGLALSVALSFYVRDDVARDARLRFERHAADAKHIIERRLYAYVGVTYGLRALFAARGSLTRLEFRRYVESLDLPGNFPGFEALNYARQVKASERRAFEEEMREDMRRDDPRLPPFAIRPPGERAEYHPVVFVEPPEGNEKSFGLDVRMVGGRGKAFEDLRATDSIISSGRLLNVGRGNFVGLAMRLPVHRPGMPLGTAEERRAAFIGSVGAGYNVKKLMAGILDQTTMKAMRYRLYDAGQVGEPKPSAGKPTLLFDSAQTAPGAPSDDYALPGEAPAFDSVLPLELAGRNWELHFSAPREAYLEGADSMLPWLALAGGLVTSALLFTVLLSFASSRVRAEALAEEITRNLRASEAELARALLSQRASAAQIRDLMRRLVSVQEAERRRFSADLHDLVGQSLSVLGMGLETIRALLPGILPQKAQSTMDHMGRLLQETMGSVREVMSDLRPPLLDDYGLHAAIEWHASQLQARTGLQVAVEGRDLGERPAPEVELALFRIAQEALINVAKHAAASRARVALARSGAQLTMVVEDNGRGLAPSAANDPAPPGWGMAVMRERAAAVGGAVHVASSDSGTRIIVEVAAR
jgi:signal transduction histidine kinase